MSKRKGSQAAVEYHHVPWAKSVAFLLWKCLLTPILGATPLTYFSHQSGLVSDSSHAGLDPN